MTCRNLIGMKLDYGMNGSAAAATLRVAAVQTVSGPDVAENLRDVADLIDGAVRRGAQLVGLPEYFPLVSADERAKIRVREPDGDGPIQAFLAAQARRHGIWLVGGSVPLQAEDDDHVKNSCLVFDPQGSRVARYDKIHLFGYSNGSERYNEAGTISPGQSIVTFDTPFGRVGVAICYDIRFPELFRAMGEVSLIVLPAAFTQTTGRAHWELLLRARAVENQCYVMAPAQGGRHPSGRVTYGDTLIVDPWGTVLDRLPGGAGVVMADLSAARLSEVRNNLPALAHRRL